MVSTLPAVSRQVRRGMYPYTGDELKLTRPINNIFPPHNYYFPTNYCLYPTFLSFSASSPSSPPPPPPCGTRERQLGSFPFPFNSLPAESFLLSRSLPRQMPALKEGTTRICPIANLMNLTFLRLGSCLVHPPVCAPSAPFAAGFETDS